MADDVTKKMSESDDRIATWADEDRHTGARASGRAPT